jgi:hypothetical protein
MREELSVGRETERGVPEIPHTQAPACVLQIYGGTVGRRYEFSAREFVIGRDPDRTVTSPATTSSEAWPRPCAER